MKVLKLLFIALLFAACSPDNGDSLSDEMNVETNADQDLKRMLEAHLGENNSTILYSKSGAASVVVGAVADCVSSTGYISGSEYVDYVYISSSKSYNRTVGYAIFKNGTPMYYDNVIVPANQTISTPLSFNRGQTLGTKVGVVTTKIFTIKNSATGVSEINGITLYEPSFNVDNCVSNPLGDNDMPNPSWDCDGDGLANQFDSTSGCDDENNGLGF